MAVSSKKKRGVLVFLQEEAGALRLNLDDVIQHDEDLSMWKQGRPITSIIFTDVALEELTFTETQLADVAYHILARLRAQKKVWDPQGALCSPTTKS